MTQHGLRVSLLVTSLMLAVIAGVSRADTATVAVAANFAAPAKALIERFMQSTGHRITLSTGSTGKLYAQIRHGAPFQVFLAADQERPERLEKEGLATPGSRFTYAVGKLVLWSPQTGLVDSKGEVLKAGSFRRLAIASPKLAPYGAAARETLQRLGVWPQVEPKLVIGENIAQTHQLSSPAMPSLAFSHFPSFKGKNKRRDRTGWCPAGCMRRSARMRYCSPRARAIKPPTNSSSI